VIAWPQRTCDKVSFAQAFSLLKSSSWKYQSLFSISMEAIFQRGKGERLGGWQGTLRTPYQSH